MMRTNGTKEVVETAQTVFCDEKEYHGMGMWITVHFTVKDTSIRYDHNCSVEEDSADEGETEIESVDWDLPEIFNADGSEYHYTIDDDFKTEMNEIAMEIAEEHIND